MRVTKALAWVRRMMVARNTPTREETKPAGLVGRRLHGQALVEYAVLVSALGLGVMIAAGIASKAFRGQLDAISERVKELK